MFEGLIKFVTPLLLVALLVFGYSCYAFSKDAQGWGKLVGMIALAVAMGLLVTDLGLRTFLSPKKLWGIELALLGVVFLYYLSEQRVEKVILPSSFKEGFVSIVYGVEGASPLSIRRTSSLSGRIEVPKEGVLWTSSSYEKASLPRTKFYFSNGEELGGPELTKGQLHAFLIAERSFEVEGRSYFYRTWKVERYGGDGYGTDGQEISREKDLLVERFLSRKGR